MKSDKAQQVQTQLQLKHLFKKKKKNDPQRLNLQKLWDFYKQFETCKAASRKMNQCI